MWTPRRVFLAIMGVFLFAGVYGGYSKLLGWVDGLPPLPEAYTHSNIGSDAPIPEFPATPILNLLRQAFGPNCLEQQPNYEIKLEVRDKGLVIAAIDHMILPDGRVQFTQLSVAIFGKNREISTLHCDRAILEFDRPVRKIEDMGDRKVWAAELHADPDSEHDDPRKGKVHIINNRRTPNNPNDDLIVKTPGPILYRDDPNRPLNSGAAPPPRHPSNPSRLPHIWTYSHIELIDKQNRPPQNQTDITVPLNTVTADGMRMYLTVENANAPKDPKDKEKKADNPAKGNPNRVSGVERVDLDRNVLMNLWSDNSSMFGDKSAPPAPPPPPVQPGKSAPPPVPKSLITIQTDGPFYYDMSKDYAHFERPEPDPQIPRYITVTRRNKGLDTLTCDFLDIQFRRKKNEPPPPKGKDGAPAPKAPPPNPEGPRQEANMDMEWLHAWGQDIAMSSEAEKLDAYGYDLIFDAKSQQTVLKGKPMVAVKEGNQIKSRELILSNLNDRAKQNARAIGPGEFGMGEFNVKTESFSRVATWQDEMRVNRIKENGKDFDLLVLTGGAEFKDTVNSQSLRALQIKLWLIPNKADSDKPAHKTPLAKVQVVKKADAPKEEQKQPLPSRMEATGQVRAYSSEMIVHDADYLNAWFKDLPAKPQQPDSKSPVVEALRMPGEKAKDPTIPSIPGAPATSNPAAMPVGPTNPMLTPVVEPKQTATGLTKKDPGFTIKKELAGKAEPKKDQPERVPIELQHARRIITWVNRTDGKNDLDRVHCEGRVIITQRPTPENKKGVRIEGTTVDMEHYPEGNNLIVVGNDEVVGQMHFDTIAIVADDIRMDQRSNEAHVKGKGWMQIQSAAKLVDDGGKANAQSKKAQPAKGQPEKKEEKEEPIVIEWDDSMELEGPTGWVLFEGRVVATQKEGMVSCENMQVKLDQPVWLNNMNRPPLKPGEKKEAPKVEKILCDQAVKIVEGKQPRKKQPVATEDREMLNGKMVKYNGAQGTTIDVDNKDNIVTIHGPGVTRIWQPGSKDPLADPVPQDRKQPDPRVARPGPKDKKPAPKNGGLDADQEMKLTLVEFKGLMKGFNKEHRVMFLDNVELTSFPSARHDFILKPGDPIPEGGMRITAERSLEMISRSRMQRDEKGQEVEFKWQEMVAEGNVRVHSEEYTGWATKLTYSEDKGMLIFYGDPEKNIPAILTKATGKGQERKKYSGEQIKYWTKTKNIEVIGGLGGSGN